MRAALQAKPLAAALGLASFLGKESDPAALRRWAPFVLPAITMVF
jgi:hypothetical protein